MTAGICSSQRRVAGGVLVWLMAATASLAQTGPGVTSYNTANSRQIALGAEHACAVEPGGAPWCWGHNASGQLGQGDTTPRSLPTRLPGLSIGAMPNGLGQGFSCARLAGGGVSCWGDNRRGQLGLGDTTRRMSPATLPGLSSVGALALGYTHTCAVQSGDLFCWGNNDQWALGLGDRDNRLTPTRIAGVTDVAQVAAGVQHTCALESQGSLYCWGNNSHGQVGQGNIGRRDRPGRVGFSTPVTAVQAGYYHSCAILQGGSLACWGRNDNGQLGLGNRNFGRDVPVQVPGLSGIVAVAAGYLHTCALRDDGRVACFGRNEHGQLGLGSTDVFVTSPTLVPGLSGVTAIAADNLSTCALTGTGELYCWGRNSMGQLGLGDTDDRRRPTLVTALGQRPTATRLDAPTRVTLGQPARLQAVVTATGATPTGQVAFRLGGTEFARAPLDGQGVARATAEGLALGTYPISASFLGGAGFDPSDSATALMFIVHPNPDFSGGGVVFAPTAGCGPGFDAAAPHPVTVHYSPSELGGLPSGVSLVWREGSEHLALWGPMLPSNQFFGAAGRGTWTRFVFYPTRPLVRVVQRQIVQPAGGDDLSRAEELVLRLRVQNFAAIPGCAVTVAAVLMRD